MEHVYKPKIYHICKFDNNRVKTNNILKNGLITAYKHIILTNKRWDYVNETFC